MLTFSERAFNRLRKSKDLEDTLITTINQVLFLMQLNVLNLEML
jgi:hypothetical protein